MNTITFKNYSTMNASIKVKWAMIICCTISCMWMKNAQAQDPHFSQYFASPMTLNPSLIGKDVADWRAAINFRTQWWGSGISPYTTTTISLEKRLAPAKSTAPKSFRPKPRHQSRRAARRRVVPGRGEGARDDGEVRYRHAGRLDRAQPLPPAQQLGPDADAVHRRGAVRRRRHRDR